jgi:hypothetical protein
MPFEKFLPLTTQATLWTLRPFSEEFLNSAGKPE